MEKSNTSTEHPLGAKRKRTPLADSAVPLSIVANGTNSSQINYLVKAGPEKLGLIDGDAETFADVLAMIDDYEGEMLLYHVRI